MPQAPAGFQPMRVLETEVSEPIQAIARAAAPSGEPYGSARVLVRVHAEPVAIVEIGLVDGTCSAEQHAHGIWDGAADAIAAHLERDDIPSPAGLTSAGLAATHPTRCEQERADFLVAAPSVTVVIPTRDRADLLERCLASIYACDYAGDRLDVIVVDNAPATDATRVAVERFAQRGCEIRYLRELASGSASARNAALPFVQGEIVAFTDDDVIVDRLWLVELARGYAGSPDVDCVTGLVIPSELETQAQLWFEQYGGFSLSGFEQRTYDLHANRGDGALYPYAAGIYGTGNNMSFRRSVLERIGGFDPALGNGTPALGGVDSEALLRTILTGHRLVYRPTSLVRHRHRRDYAGLHRQIYCYGVGLTAYLTKTAITYPRLIPDMLSRALPGIRYALSSSSPLHEKKSSDFPRALTLAELRGMAYGPFAYARSVRRHGRRRVGAAVRVSRRSYLHS